MKNKRPSLLDVEVFAKKRADNQLDKLKKIERATFEAPEQPFEIVDEEVEPTSYAQEPEQPTEEVPDAFMEELVDFVTTYRNEILSLKNDLFKVKEQVRIFSTMMNSQQKKISQLMASQQQGDTDNSVTDDNYYRLVLRNIIWLKEEKGFTTNDVIRLFRAEGFQTPAPHKAWDKKVVERLYAEAKRTIY
ncbi:hypothetical protein [Desulfobacter vibrioformis]|uniref:hypothetical protein n=1 Tax=Desulfobacter vibrioformis TaxID=34031 RepID=UPI0005580056|nr:hypothetical protein [Desulfobacter vibrioformis]